MRMKRFASAILCLVYLSSFPSQPLWAQNFREGPAGEKFQVQEVPLIAPLAGEIGVGFSESALSENPDHFNQESSFQIPAAPLPEKAEKILAVNPSTDSPKKVSPASPEIPILNSSAHSFPAAATNNLESSVLSHAAAIHFAIVRASGQDSIEDARQKSDFVDFYQGFVKSLDSKFSSPEYNSSRALFLRNVEQGRFHAVRPGVGEIETKLIAGHVCLRFASKGAKPLTVVVANVPLVVNEGLAPLKVETESSSSERELNLDLALRSPKLDTYRSRLLISRKIILSKILTSRSLGNPHRAVLVINDLTGAALLSPALEHVNGRWWRHWIKGTLEPFHYGDVFRGILSSSIQFTLAYGMALLARHIQPAADSFTWGPAVASGLFALMIATFSDSYAAFVQRGDNRIWESAKRLMIAAFLSYPICIMQAHGDWRVIFTLQTNVLVWLVGLGDRYLSTAMNVVPKIHQKYYMKPWFFPVRMKTPLRDAAANFFHNPNLKNSTIKGVTMTREALAISRFAIKFPGLFLDPLIMRYTHGVPVATILLWTLGLPFEIFNYHAVKKLALENPRIQEEFLALKAHRERLVSLFGFLRKSPRTAENEKGQIDGKSPGNFIANREMAKASRVIVTPLIVEFFKLGL